MSEKPECSIAGCDSTAVAEILIDGDCYRCPDCLLFDGRENDWW